MAVDQKKKVDKKVKYPGIRITTNGNQLVSLYTESRVADAGIFYPITASTEMGEMFELSVAKGELNVFGNKKIAIETEGEHAAQGGAIAMSLTGRRVVNFTSGQGIVYAIEQYYHAPPKFSTMVLEVAARALTKHALNVHCGHDDIYAALDTGWTMLFAKDAQQAADQAVILRKVNELSLNPGINIQDGFLTSHLERTFLRCESPLLREFLGRTGDIIDTPTESQQELFGKKRRRLPAAIDLKLPHLVGPVQNQEHFMQGVAARRNHFVEPILQFLEDAYKEFGDLTGRYYGLLTEYNTKDADTVFVAMGSACENIEAVSDYLKKERKVKVGVIHVNCLRPFPEAAIVKALKGKKNVIILERTDEPMSGDNPLTREIRAALNKAVSNSKSKAYHGIPKITLDDVPRIFSGCYGMGSRDFRPEGILGAYEYAAGEISREDGKRAKDGESFFYVGINHPYAVVSKDTPSLLPDGAISVRFHSVGGWGAITTGKNLGEIIGELGHIISEHKGVEYDEHGREKEILHVSANPKYGSEKKGSPTNYFLVVAPERIRVTCDLKHVKVVLCCDPKAFTHTNPLEGLEDGGAFIWESQGASSPEEIWERIPKGYRAFIRDKNIRVFSLDGFDIAGKATERQDLKYRMQGNAFLGAFFKVSPFLKNNGIQDDEFLKTVEEQYNKKFGKFGEAVVASNMQVMKEGFSHVVEVPYGESNAKDKSSLRGDVLVPLNKVPFRFEKPEGAKVRKYEKIVSLSAYDDEFRSGKGYDQEATPLMATGVMAAATGATSSKYVARQLKPVWVPNNCTQCMACITACPDTALPNTAQEVKTVLKTIFTEYVHDGIIRDGFLKNLDKLEESIRTVMKEEVAKKGDARVFGDIAYEKTLAIADDVFPSENERAKKALSELKLAFEKVHFGYSKVNAIFNMKEKKEPGEGGLFSIMVSDLCKGCGECATECGDHEALVMVPETPEINADHLTGIKLLDRLPSTPQKYLGLFDSEHVEDSKAAALQNHLMVREYYDAVVSGDGACAGCGEKSILRSIATLTEAFMRPMFHRKADRLVEKADLLEKEGHEKLAEAKKKDPESYEHWRRTFLHMIYKLGGENKERTDERIKQEFKGDDKELIKFLTMVLRRDAYNHKELQTIEGRAYNGMSAMAMAASTGCNTVYGSTHPNNPHPYPWLNSLFQDGPTIGWMLGEHFIDDHTRRSVIPERLTDYILNGFDKPFTDADYFDYTHYSDSMLTPLEVEEMPKVWVVGGDGALGDIGYQNLSKAVLQNRPNVKMIMLDTQVYSNTGGQNSDSTPMPGGNDMNQIGEASQGKLTEKKSVSETLLAGHGSPYVAQVSMANSANLYRSILEGLQYRGTSFIQSYTTCQPEHGVPDSMSAKQAQQVRDSRGMPEFVSNPTLGETAQEMLNIKGNPQPMKDWYTKRIKGTETSYKYTVAHWATTENRFRRHFFKVKDTKDLVHLDDYLLRVMQDDVINRKFLLKDHRSYIPKAGVYIEVEQKDGSMKPIGLSRQMVLFCVERRKAWRLLQGRAGVTNEDYIAQKKMLKDFDEDKIDAKEFMSPKIQEIVQNYAPEKK